MEHFCTQNPIFVLIQASTYITVGAELTPNDLEPAEARGMEEVAGNEGLAYLTQLPDCIRFRGL